VPGRESRNPGGFSAGWCFSATPSEQAASASTLWQTESLCSRRSIGRGNKSIGKLPVAGSLPPGEMVRVFPCRPFVGGFTFKSFPIQALGAHGTDNPNRFPGFLSTDDANMYAEFWHHFCLCLIRCNIKKQRIEILNKVQPSQTALTTRDSSWPR
jgi:hypothetical protein